MKSDRLFPVILAGGSGTRLWPASRQMSPKQFLPLVGDESLLQQTIRRLKGLDHATPCVICNEAHRFLAAEQLRRCGLEQAPILLEPQARNTAPAIALAALYVSRGGEDPLLLVLAADHLIRDTAAFHAAIGTAIPLACQGNLVTFGVPPTRAETGYGYIARSESLSEHGARVQRFMEKPDRATAERYLRAGGFLWNSGIFLFRASVYLDELEKHEPAVLRACRDALGNGQESGETLSPFIRLVVTAFAASPNISIDHAVMERTSSAAVVPLEAGWSDLGSWAALWEAGMGDENGNVLKGDVQLDDVRECFIDSEHGLVACLGVRNLIVVVTRDAVLVADKDKAQDLAEHGRHEILRHREAFPARDSG
ncbi:MAG: mannose-1-phosphate guanylyltransferase [Rhodospirillaceae bacterium]|nr:MAG: mannose-1-phosphate guanylyltransferase [Rhodospirillaceae bacterium]